MVSVDAARGADAHSFMAFRGNDAAKQIKLKSKFAGAEADVEVSGAPVHTPESGLGRDSIRPLSFEIAIWGR